MKILSSILFVGAIAMSAQAMAHGGKQNRCYDHTHCFKHYGHKHCHQHCTHRAHGHKTPGKFYVESPIGEDQVRALQRLRDRN